MLCQALISLNAMYVKHRANGTPITTEVEFRAYHLLTLIGTHGRYGYNAAEFQNALAVRPCINPNHSPPMRNIPTSHFADHIALCCNPREEPVVLLWKPDVLTYNTVYDLDSRARLALLSPWVSTVERSCG